MLAAGPAAAQDLAALQNTAEAKTADWDALGKTLEGKLVRMLPCDARVRTSVEEVSRASDARIAAVSQYFQAAAARSQADNQAIAQAIGAQEPLAREMDSERAEADQERIAIDAQLADLADSLKRRQQLADAQRTLGGIADMVRLRVSSAEQKTATYAALIAALRALSAANEAREKAIRTEISALTLEGRRWSEYYSARIARAQTECSITNQTPERSPSRRKKQ